MTSTHETPMSLFSHNKCGKKLGAGLIFYFTFYSFGGAYAPNPPPSYGPALIKKIECTELAKTQDRQRVTGQSSTSRPHSACAGFIQSAGGMWPAHLIKMTAADDWIVSALYGHVNKSRVSRRQTACWSNNSAVSRSTLSDSITG